MVNYTDEQVHNVSVAKDGIFKNALVTVAAGALELPEGTVLEYVPADNKFKPCTASSDHTKAGGVLTYGVKAEAAGDVAARVLVGGDVLKGALKIAGEADGGTITDTMVHALRSNNIGTLGD